MGRFWGDAHAGGRRLEIHGNRDRYHLECCDITGGSRLINEFRAARRDPDLAVLEGLHPLKHALRFGAAVERVVTRGLDALEQLCRTLAPDVADQITGQAARVDADVFGQLAPVAPRTGVIAIARRVVAPATRVLDAPRTAPVIVLERPSDLGNIGACVRVAASAGASGVITTGPHDPWHPVAIRGAAGLQYALPVARVENLSESRGPLLAIHPEGEPLTPNSIESDAVLVFGSERRGLSEELLSRVDRRIAIPMEPHVSSLNLATAVAVVLYTWRLQKPM